MDCKHQAKFSFKTLFARKPTYICKKCGVDLEMTVMTQSISRALNSILIAALFFKVLAGKPAENVQGMITSFAVLLLYILIYIIAYYFLVTFGKFVEKAPAEPAATIEPASEPADEPAGAPASGPAADLAHPDDTASTDALTKEQQDLIALYNSYAPTEEQASADTPAATPTPAQVEPAHEACVHAPQKSWKIYIPSQFNFTCEHCGQPITFSQQTKKYINLVIMAIIFAILMPSFMNPSVNWFQFLGLTALAVALSTVVQYYFVTKSKYILNPQPPQNRPSRQSRLR